MPWLDKLMVAISIQKTNTMSEEQPRKEYVTANMPFPVGFEPTELGKAIHCMMVGLCNIPNEILENEPVVSLSIKVSKWQMSGDRKYTINVSLSSTVDQDEMLANE